MFGKHIKENPVAIDITQKRVKIWWGGTKLVLTTKAEQRKMREMIQHIDPSITVIDSRVKKEKQLEWIDRVEEFDALFDP